MKQQPPSLFNFAMIPTRSTHTDRPARAFPWVLATSVAATALLIVAVFLVWRAGMFVPALDADRVVLGDAESGLFAPEVTVPGVVVDMATTAAPSPEDGSVSQIHFRNGDRVAAGDVVLLLRNSALEREVADNLVRLGREALAIEAQIAELDRRLNDSRSQLRDIAFRKRQAVMELERNLVLEQRGFASPARMERLRDEVAFYAEEESNAREVLENTRQDADRRSERLNAAQARLERLSQSIADRLEGLTIRAPADGQISGLTLSVGEPVSSGEVLFTVTRGRPDRISAQVMESAAQDLFVGLEARLRAPHSGELSIEAIDPQARDGAVDVRLAFLSEPSNALRAGQMVQIAIQTDEPRSAVTVPFGELVGPDVIWVYDAPNGTATPRPVQLGQRAGARVEVLAGLSDGETILVSAPRPIDGFRSVRIRGAQNNE